MLWHLCLPCPTLKPTQRQFLLSIFLCIDSTFSILLCLASSELLLWKLDVQDNFHSNYFVLYWWILYLLRNYFFFFKYNWLMSLANKLLFSNLLTSKIIIYESFTFQYYREDQYLIDISSLTESSSVLLFCLLGDEVLVLFWG